MLFRLLFVITSIFLSQSLSEAFTCTTTGKFVNTYDPTCKTFYSCNDNEDQIIGTLYKCPNTFDPDTKECSDNYVCKKDEFSCSSSGYFPNLSDTECVKYYNCFNLFFGFYIKFSHSCSKGYQFDPYKRHCSSSYKCEDYLLAPEEVKVTQSPADSFITETKSNTLEDVTDIPEEISLRTSLNIEFVCTEEGLFPDTVDKSCSSYFYCVPMSDGKFVKRLYKCPNYFNPDTKRCTDNYICNYGEEMEIDVSGTTESNTEVDRQSIEEVMKNITEAVDTENSTESRIESATNNDMEIIIETTVETYLKDGENMEITTEVNGEDTTETLTEIVTEINTSLKTDKDTKITEEATTELNSTQEITTESTSTKTGIENNVELTGKVNMIYLDTTTIGYTETTQSNSDSIVSESTERTSTPTSENIFQCGEVGRFPDYSDRNCIQYFLCSKLHNGTFITTSYKCPVNSYFDPEATRCSKTYQCHITSTLTTPVDFNATEVEVYTTQYYTEEAESVTTEEIQNTTEAEQTTTESVQTTINVVEGTTKREEFECTSTGKFPNLDDETCRTYYLCTRRKNGTFVKTPFECQGSFFDPNLRRCSKDYKCASTTVTEIPTSTIMEWNFSCDKVGRFKNENDLGCKSYFLCSQFRNGTFVKTMYDCPKSSIFNSEKHVCSDMISCAR